MSEKLQTHGKRKTAVARVTIAPGSGLVQINNERTIDDFFPRETHRRSVLSPLVLADRLNAYDVRVRVRGGGITGQAEAIRHGIARALVQLDEELRPLLKKAGFLTRDSRIVESKKYGHHKARKRPQFSKR